MSFCRECGTHIDERDRFCGGCGAAVSNGPAPAEPVDDTIAAPATDPTAAPNAVPTSSPGPSTGARAAMWIGAVAAVGLGGLGIYLVTRDDTGSTPTAASTSAAADPTTSVPVASASTTPPPTTVAATTPPATTAAPSTAPPTTAAPTTVPVTTVAPTTVAPPTTGVVPLGWRPAEFPDQAWPRLEGNWIGEASPSDIDPNQPLPDGRYQVEVGDVDAATGQIALAVHRYEQCLILGEYGCSFPPWNDDDVGSGEDLGIVFAPFDTNLQVTVLGWQACDIDVWTGSGPDFEDLYNRFRQGYDTALGSAFDAGIDPEAVVQDVRTNPVAGFSIPTAECDQVFDLQWDSGDGPVILIPWASGPGGAIDPMQIMVPTMLEIDGPVTHLFIYAGYYP